jgi:putative PIN family toxin of toxin-antitoxin system
VIVVIDSSVWISALQFGTNPTPPVRAVEHALRRDSLATSIEIEAEIKRILVAKFNWAPAKANTILARYLKRAIRVELHGSVHVCRDPNDDMILECAVLSGAQTIISGDKDLLSLRAYQDIRIVTPAQYLSRPG